MAFDLESRNPLYTLPDASTIDASTNPTSTPSASLEPMGTSSDLAAAAPMDTTQPLLNLQFLSRHTILHISVLTAMHTLPHEWFIRFTSRSLHTPTTNVSYLLRRYQLREFLNVEILNTSSMASRELGNGPCKLQIIGAIILKFLYYMGTILFATEPLRRLHRQTKQDMSLLSRLWPGSYRIH